MRVPQIQVTFFRNAWLVFIVVKAHPQLLQILPAGVTERGTGNYNKYFKESQCLSFLNSALQVIHNSTCLYTSTL